LQGIERFVQPLFTVCGSPEWSKEEDVLFVDIYFTAQR
jgi:hypothetical protein